MKPHTLVVVMLLGATAAPVAAEPLQTRGRAMMIQLTGEAHGVGLGDPDGSGTAELLIDARRGRFCYMLSVEGIQPARLAHIHKSPVGQAGGPIVVHLEPPTDGDSEGCQAIEPAIARSLLENPADYYVNVHNPEFPGGAIRGQLG